MSNPIDALKWIAARAEYAHDFCGDEDRKEIIAEIARVATEALKSAALEHGVTNVSH